MCILFFVFFGSLRALWWFIVGSVSWNWDPNGKPSGENSSFKWVCVCVQHALWDWRKHVGWVFWHHWFNKGMEESVLKLYFKIDVIIWSEFHYLFRKDKECVIRDFYFDQVSLIFVCKLGLFARNCCLLICAKQVIRGLSMSRLKWRIVSNFQMNDWFDAHCISLSSLYCSSFFFASHSLSEVLVLFHLHFMVCRKINEQGDQKYGYIVTKRLMNQREMLL